MRFLVSDFLHFRYATKTFHRPISCKQHVEELELINKLVSMDVIVEPVVGQSKTDLEPCQRSGGK